MTRRDEIYVGDAVVPQDEPTHEVMTVYDFEVGRTMALCNWLVGTRMLKARYPTDCLLRIERIRAAD